MNPTTQRPMEHFGHSKGEDGSCTKCGAKQNTYEVTKLCPRAEMIHIDVLRREVDTLTHEFGGIKSGKKLKKKVQQMYRRDVQRLTQKEVDERLKALNALVRERPRWVPRWVWTMVRSVVLRDTIEV